MKINTEDSVPGATAKVVLLYISIDSAIESTSTQAIEVSQNTSGKTASFSGQATGTLSIIPARVSFKTRASVFCKPADYLSALLPSHQIVR